MGKILIIVGILLIVIGGLIYLGGRLIPIGRLPGDIVIKKEKVVFYFPLMTSLIISGILTLIFMIISKLTK